MTVVDLFEYRVEPVPGAQALAAWGQEGWELVGIDAGRAYLKRSAEAYRDRVTVAQRERALAQGAASPLPVPPAQRRLLQPDLLRLFASAGHTDLVTICDRGFPVPLGPERLDLAVADDLPTVPDILGLLRPQFVPDRLVIAQEARATCPWRVAALATLLPETTFDFVSHAELKGLAAGARATVRTGDSAPYGNVIWVG